MDVQKGVEGAGGPNAAGAKADTDTDTGDGRATSPHSTHPPSIFLAAQGATATLGIYVDAGSVHETADNTGECF